MALKPTIYKMRIALSDVNRHHYDTLNLTVAQHPSETLERMMVRVLAYCLNAQPNLTFTRGLSTTEEPDLWLRTPDDQIALWIDVGEPSPERIKKATRLAREVKVYSFNTKATTWWQQGRDRFQVLSASVYQFPWEAIRLLATLVERTLDISVTISDESLYVAAARGECEVPWITLQREPQK